MSRARKFVRTAAAAAVLVLLPAAAHAIPILAAAAAFAGSVGAITATTAFIIQVGLAVYGAVDARRKAKRLAARQRAEYNASLQDRSVSGVFPSPPWRVTYGTAVSGGDVVAMFTTDKTALRENGTSYTKPDALRHLVVHLATHRSQAINEVYLDGVPVGVLDANGWATSGEFTEQRTVTSTVIIEGSSSLVVSGTGVQILSASIITANDEPAPTSPTVTDLGNGTTRITNVSSLAANVSYTLSTFFAYVRVSKHLGEDDQTVDTYLNGLLPTKWTANHRLRGLTYIVLTLDLENQRFQGGPPGITASLSGRLLLDPRTSTTAHSANNALCVADWLKAPWGFEASDSEISEAHAIAAANVCDAAQSFTTNSTNDGTRWDFLNASQGWTVSGATLAVNADSVTLTSTGSDPVLRSPPVSPGLPGSSYRYVRVRVRRLAGAGWQGTVFYSTSGHGESESFKKTLANPSLAVGGAWAELEWDMHSLTAGGSDWSSNSVTSFRIDLGSTSSDVFEIDWVSLNKPVPTYTCNGAFTTEHDKTQVLEDLCESMAGFATYGAQWQVSAGAWTPPVTLPGGADTLTDDDLVGQLELVQAGAPSEYLFSGVRGTFIPRGASSPADFDPYQDAVLLAGDAEELWEDVAYPFTDDKYRCKNLARIRVERARNGLVVRGAFKLKAWPLQVGDRTKLTNAEYGFSAKTFRITDWQFGVHGFVVLTLQEDAADAWDFAPAASADPTPNSELPSPWVVDAPVNVQAASGTAHLVRTKDGTVVPRVLVSWNAPTSAYMEDGGHVEVLWRRSRLPNPLTYAQETLAGSETSVYLWDVKEGDPLIIRVRFRNSLGRLSSETPIAHIVVGKTQPPSNVTGLTHAITGSGVEIKWNPGGDTDLDYDETELRVGGTGYDNATRLFRGRASTWTWPFPAIGTYTVRAKHYDTSGIASASEAPLSVTVDASSQVTWGSLAGRPKIFRVVANGFSATTSPASTGLYDAESGSQLLSVINRSYMLARIRRADGVITFQRQYDVFGDGAEGGFTGANLAADLNASGSDHVVVVFTHDEPRGHRNDNGLSEALYRCGASQACFGSPEFKSRSAYILIGIPGCGEGNGHEAYQGAIDADPNAWCDSSFSLQFGNYQVGGASFSPRTLRDYSYVGNLNATSDLTLVLHGGAGTAAGNTVQKSATGSVAWDTGWYSAEMAAGGAYAQGTLVSTTDTMVALKDADTGGGPAFSSSYEGLDYAIYGAGGGNLYAYELGVGVQIGTWVGGDRVLVTYDGQRIRYHKNGTVLRTTENVGPNRRFHLDTSVHTPGGSIQSLGFGPLSPVVGIATPQLGGASVNETLTLTSASYGHSTIL